MEEYGGNMGEYGGNIWSMEEYGGNTGGVWEEY